MADVIPLLPPSRIKFADSVRNIWRAVAEESHTHEQILNPTYWAHAAQQVRAGDHINVVSDTGAFFIELYVQEVGKGYAKVFELRYVEMVKSEDESLGAPVEDYEIKYKGPHNKFCVIRKQDGVAIKSEFQTKPEANQWLSEYLKIIPDVKVNDNQA